MVEYEDFVVDCEDSITEEYINSCNVVEEWDDYRGWAVVEDAADYDEIIEEHAKEWLANNEIELTKEQFEDFISDAKCVLPSENDLQERAIECYGD